MIAPASETGHTNPRPRAERVVSFVKKSILVAIVLAWFLGHAWRGMLIGFHPDDVMNLHFAWRPAVRQLVLSNLVPFTHYYRPAGQAVYRTVYALAGFHPRPFRVVSYCLLALNLLVLFVFVRRLTGSAEMAFLAAFLASWHPRLEDFYRNNGTLYDVLCFLFTYATLAVYLKVRPRADRLSGRTVAAFYALLVLALNSKEVAFATPALLWLYELIYAPPRSFSPLWLFRGKLLVWLATLLTAGAIAGKMTGDNAFRNNPGYALAFTWKQYLTASSHYMSELFCRPPDSVPPVAIVLSQVALFAGALLLRKRSLLFLACIAVVAPLPVVFIPPRGLFAYSVAFAAWAGYVAAFLVYAREWLWKVVWHRPELPATTWEPERVFLFLLVAVSVMQFHSLTWPIEWGDEYKPIIAIRSLVQDVLHRHPALPKHASILLVDDGFEVDNYTPFFTLQLAYHDKTLGVNRTKMMEPARAASAPQFHDHVFAYTDGRYTEVKCGR